MSVLLSKLSSDLKHWLLDLVKDEMDVYPLENIPWRLRASLGETLEAVIELEHDDDIQLQWELRCPYTQRSLAKYDHFVQVPLGHSVKTVSRLLHSIQPMEYEVTAQHLWLHFRQAEA